MRIVDAFTGCDVRLGDIVPSEGGKHDWQLLDVDERSLFDVRVCVQEIRSGRVHWLSLTMRFLHPSYLFQRVGFVQT
jgi:hypothetical protein